MRKRLLAVVLALTLAAAAVFAVAAPTHAASSAFGGNVCRLVTAKQIAAFPGVSTTCKNARPMPALGATQYVGNWASRTPTSSNLQVTVARYTDPQALQLARRNLNQGLSGTPERVAAIGSGAFEAAGAGSATLNFTTGKFVVYLAVTARNPRQSLPSLRTLAKSLAAKLA